MSPRVPNGWGDPSTERHLQVPPRHATPDRAAKPRVGTVKGWLLNGVVYPVRQAVEDTDPAWTARHGGQHEIRLSAGLDEWYAALDRAVDAFESEWNAE